VWQRLLRLAGGERLALAGCDWWRVATGWLGEGWHWLLRLAAVVRWRWL